MSNTDFEFFDNTIKGSIRYYTHLSIQGRERFCKRVKDFMQEKEFEGMEGFEVTDEMKILISAAAIQLTFGLQDFSLEGHHLLRIFPITFYNTRTGDEYKGLTLRKGLIALSWEDFEKGYLIDDDHFNLGLHELAHVLRLSVNTDDFDHRFANYLDDWDNICSQEFEHMQQYPDDSFLRSYASTNPSEFFSVCVEYFFEVPQKFSNQLPEIYNHLCVLLNQNPLNINNDYYLNNIQKNIETSGFSEKEGEPKIRLKEWPQQVDTIIVIGFFVGMLCFWLLVGHMKINFRTLCTLSGYAFLIMLVLTQLFRSAVTMRKLDFVDIMRMILLAPFISLLIFTVNFFTPLKDTSESYKIINFKIRPQNPTTYKVELLFEDDALNSFKELRTFKTETNSYGWQQVSYQFETGIFGFQNLKSRTIINQDKTEIIY